MTNETDIKNPFAARYTDLLNERVGGKALSCTDEWFAPCANLVKHSDPVFKAGHFVDTGQWMDGWESRRSFGRKQFRPGGRDHDWCVVKLGIPGTIAGVDIETTHFRGNAPEYAALEGCYSATTPDEHTRWSELLSKSPTEAHSHNYFATHSGDPCTHLRLNIFPDGGVARLRVYGEAEVDRNHFVGGELIDLASVMHGGRGLSCSDMFYSSPSNLLMPGSGVNMGDGWETRRRRDASNDWCIIRLGLPGSIRKVILDTAHFKGNFPDTFSLEAAHIAVEDFSADDIDWQTVIARTPLHADQEHCYIKQIEVPEQDLFNHVRLNIFPDGGVSRLRVLGFPDWSQSMNNQT